MDATVREIENDLNRLAQAINPDTKPWKVGKRSLKTAFGKTKRLGGPVNPSS